MVGLSILASPSGYAVAAPCMAPTPCSLPCMTRSPHNAPLPPILGSVNGYAVAPPFTTATPFSLPCMTRSPHTMHHFQRN